MTNKLEKTPQFIGGGSGGTGGSGGDSGGNQSISLPPEGSKCYEDLLVKVAQLWPYHIIAHIQPDKGGDYLRVSDFGGDYVWRVTGTCQNGYIKINYTLIQSPGIGSD